MRITPIIRDAPIFQPAENICGAAPSDSVQCAGFTLPVAIITVPCSTLLNIAVNECGFHSCTTHAHLKSKVLSNNALIANFYVVFHFLDLLYYFLIVLLCQFQISSVLWTLLEAVRSGATVDLQTSAKCQR